ncbi:hypothetical protein D6D05_07312 [Aureobasidium pullulans]|nr:hypothetical protein D6D05_07312 [Aureobasidium pullulans]
MEIGSAFIPALLLLFGVMNSPESPRWLVRQNRVEEAYESLIRLRGRNNKMLATRDLHYLCVKITSRKGKEGADTDRAYQRFIGLFEKVSLHFEYSRQSTHLKTVNILAFYSSTIFAHIQGNQAKSLKQVRKALLFTFGFGAINFTFGWLAFWQIDRCGRRFLLLSTLPFMFLSLFIAGLCYRTLELHTRMELVSLFVFFFTVFYSPGPGPVAFAYSAEVFRIEYREIGMGWAVAMNNLFASGLSIIFPRLFFTFGGIGAFEFFAGLNILALILVFFYVPETHQLTLEQLDAIFDQDIGAHVAYGNKVLQWFWSTYLLGKHEESCPQFYNGEPRSYVEPESRVLR